MKILLKYVVPLARNESKRSLKNYLGTVPEIVEHSLGFYFGIDLDVYIEHKRFVLGYLTMHVVFSVFTLLCIAVDNGASFLKRKMAYSAPVARFLYNGRQSIVKPIRYPLARFRNDVQALASFVLSFLYNVPRVNKLCKALRTFKIADYIFLIEYPANVA